MKAVCYTLLTLYRVHVILLEKYILMYVTCIFTTICWIVWIKKILFQPVKPVHVSIRDGEQLRVND